MELPHLALCYDNNSTCSMLISLIIQMKSIRSETAIKLNNTVQVIEELIPETQYS